MKSYTFTFRRGFVFFPGKMKCKYINSTRIYSVKHLMCHVAKFPMSNTETLYDIISDNKAYSANTNEPVENFMNIMYRDLVVFKTVV